MREYGLDHVGALTHIQGVFYKWGRMTLELSVLDDKLVVRVDEGFQDLVEFINAAKKGPRRP